MLENIRLSLSGIWSHKMRSMLTMLGIIIGIAAIIAIVSIIKGTNEQIKNNLIGDGTNTVTIQINKDGWVADFEYEEIPAGIPTLTESIREELLAVDEINRVTFLHARDYSYNIYFNNTSLNSNSLYGIDQYYFETVGMRIVNGRGFSDSDFTKQHKVAIIDSKTESGAFGGEDPIGRTIDISGEPFTVIGVVEKKSQFEPVINSVDDYYTYMGNTNGVIYIPDQNWPIIYKYDEPQKIILQATSTDDMTSAGKKATDIMNSHLTVSTNSNITYKGSDLADEASQLQQLSNSTNAMLVGIASISLLVGGIGVMNIMLVSVTERTREIGLKKALGARKRTILGQFLTEAAMLSSIGGVFGIIFGIIAANVISAIAMIPVAISIPAILVAVIFSMFVGIIFGLIPSVKASNLNPIDALRYE